MMMMMMMMGLDKYKQYLIALYYLQRMIMFETISYPYRPEVLQWTLFGFRSVFVIAIAGSIPDCVTGIFY